MPAVVAARVPRWAQRARCGGAAAATGTGGATAGATLARRDPPARPARLGSPERRAARAAARPAARTIGGAGTTSTAGTTGAARARPSTAGVGGAWRCPAGPFTAPTLTGRTPQRLQERSARTRAFAPGFSIIRGAGLDRRRALRLAVRLGLAPAPVAAHEGRARRDRRRVERRSSVASNGLAVDARGDIIRRGPQGRLDSPLVPRDPLDVDRRRRAIPRQALQLTWNDVAVRSDGTVYFSDPDAFQAPAAGSGRRSRASTASRPRASSPSSTRRSASPTASRCRSIETTLFVDGDVTAPVQVRRHARRQRRPQRSPLRRRDIHLAPTGWSWTAPAISTSSTAATSSCSIHGRRARAHRGRHGRPVGVERRSPRRRRPRDAVHHDPRRQPRRVRGGSRWASPACRTDPHVAFPESSRLGC